MFFKYKKAQGIIEFALLIALIGLAGVYALQTKDKTEQVIQKTSYELRDNFDYNPTKPTAPTPSNTLKAPVANFSISDLNTGNFTIRTGSRTATNTSTDADGKIEYWVWSINGKQVQVGGMTLTHTFSIDNRLSLSQSYTISLFVEDNDGLTDTCAKTFKISRPAPPAFTIRVSGRTDVFVDETHSYTMSVTNWGGSYDTHKITSIVWNGSSTGSTTYSKKFTTAGYTNITCTAKNDWGQTATYTLKVKVEDFTLVCKFSGISERVCDTASYSTITYTGSDMSTPADKIDWVKYSVGVYSSVWVGPSPKLVSAASSPSYKVQVPVSEGSTGVFWIALTVGNTATGKTASASEIFFVLRAYHVTDAYNDGWIRDYMSYKSSITPDNKNSNVPGFSPSWVRDKLLRNMIYRETDYYYFDPDFPPDNIVPWPVN